MTEQPEAKEVKEAKSYDGSVGDMAKALINDLLKESQDVHGDTPLDKIRNLLKFDKSQNALSGVAALSTYMHARAAERQATAMESIAKTASKLQLAESVEVAGQAIVDQRESKREYLATTFSLPTETLSLLWAVRGMLVDASIKSLSRPDRLDPYRRLTTEELAWTLRLSSTEFIARLPRTTGDGIDFDLLENFDIVHYGGSPEAPDEWLYNG